MSATSNATDGVTKQSPMLSGASTTRSKSPWLAPNAWFRSACSVLVGTPVEGPARMTLMMTAGVSYIDAMPIASVISANPPPEVAHIARTPVWAAPIAMLMTPISSSTCRTIMFAARACGAIQWRTPVAGLIG